MQRRLILFLIFMSASLTAMNHEGTWDEHGNYLGPIPQTDVDQSYAPQVMMMPQLVYMPVYVDPYGQQMPFMPNMPYGMPSHMPMMQPPFGMMPHQFPMMYHPEQFVEPSSDQWAAPAPEQTIIADANPAAPSRESTTPTLQVVSSSSSTSPTAPALAEQGSLARQVEIFAHEDKEVESITTRMESVAIVDKSSVEKSAPALVKHWADVQDSPSPTPTPTIAVAADDAKNDIPVVLPSDPMIPESHVSSSSASTSSTPSTSRSLSPQPKPAVVSYLQAVQAKKNNPLPLLRPVAASSTSSNPKRSRDERLQDALAELGTSKITDRVSQLTRNKFEWINTLASESDRMKEWEKFAQLLQQSGALSVEAQAPEQATSLFNVATTLVEQLKNIDKKSTARKKFARLAVQCVSSASGILPAHLVEQASQVSDQAAALLESKKGAIDQSNISEEEFYAGYTIAQEKPAREKKAAKPVAQPAAVQAVKKAAAKKTAPQPKKVSKKNKEPKKQQSSAPATPQVAQPEPPQPSLEERIEKLLSGTRAQCNQGFALLEQVAEGTIADVDPAFQVWAMRRAADFYLYGYTPDKATHPFVKQNISRAQYFLNKAMSIDEQISDLQSMVLISFEHDRKKVVEYTNRLEAHSESSDQMKQFARLLRASAQFMDDEEGQLAGDAFTTFMTMHNDFAFNRSMLPVSNVLPKSFWEWMQKRITVWLNELERSTDTDLDLKTNARLEWTYWMGRLYLDSELEGSARLTDFFSHAMGWIQTAADHGNPRAQLYLAKPIRADQPALCVHDRMSYLRSALGNNRPRSNAEHEHTVRVCEEYARQGFLAPLADYLCLRNNAQMLDEALESLKDNFPVIHIANGSVKTFVVAQEAGLIDELQKRVSDSWVVRAILSALEISECRDAKMPVSAATIVRIDNAFARIKEDLHDHPQLKSLMAAYYSTRAFVTKRISSEVSFGTLNQGIQLMKQVCHDYEKAIAQGDAFGKFTYGALLLKTNVVFKETETVDFHPKGLALLQELAEGEDTEYKTAVLELLINHYAEQQDLDNMDHYLKMARQHALSIYHHERVKVLKGIAQALLLKRNPRLFKKKDLQKEAKQIQVARQVQSAQNGEAIQNLKCADEYVSLALTKARTRPFEALQDLRTMNGFQIQQYLYSNPRMIALCYMALDDLNVAAADPALIKESAREVFLKTLDPFYHTMGQASLLYQEKANKPDHKPNKFEDLIRAYLDAYHLRERVAIYIKTVRAGEGVQTLHPGPLQMDRISEMMALWDSSQQDEYLQICINDAQQKRETYQAALAQEEADLSAALENSQAL